MGHAILLPDDLYQKLATAAARQGETPDELLAEWVRLFVSDASTNTDSQSLGHLPTEVASDPLTPFIGAFTSGADGGWIERHDEAFADEGETGGHGASRR